MIKYQSNILEGILGIRKEKIICLVWYMIYSWQIDKLKHFSPLTFTTMKVSIKKKFFLLSSNILNICIRYRQFVWMNKDYVKVENKHEFIKNKRFYIHVYLNKIR